MNEVKVKWPLIGKYGVQQDHCYDQIIKKVEFYEKIEESKYMPWSPDIL